MSVLLPFVAIGMVKIIAQKQCWMIEMAPNSISGLGGDLSAREPAEVTGAANAVFIRP